MWLLLTLALSLCLSLGHQVERGCDDWTLDSSSSSKVCCKKCKPGNRLVSWCGSNVKELCKPCENGTFNDLETAMSCKSCTQCIGPQRVKQQCSASSDTVCECVQGFVCGNRACTFCIKQCDKGEEPTENRGCRPCPEGTFNSQINHRCVKWSSSCPSPDQQIVAAGTAVSDIVCADVEPTKIPLQTDNSMVMPVLAIICACLIISSAMCLCMTLYFKKEKSVKMPPGPVESPAAGRRLTPEPEQCSFCFPQEERGSHSSLLSNDKPFELVV